MLAGRTPRIGAWSQGPGGPAGCLRHPSCPARPQRGCAARIYTHASSVMKRPAEHIAVECLCIRLDRRCTQHVVMNMLAQHGHLCVETILYCSAARAHRAYRLVKTAMQGASLEAYRRSRRVPSGLSRTTASWGVEGPLRPNVRLLVWTAPCCVNTDVSTCLTASCASTCTAGSSALSLGCKSWPTSSTGEANISDNPCMGSICSWCLTQVRAHRDMERSP